ncbi:hypothetical protein D3C73_1326880 [compost metagenome]
MARMYISERPPVPMRAMRVRLGAWGWAVVAADSVWVSVESTLTMLDAPFRKAGVNRLTARLRMGRIMRKRFLRAL